MTDRELTRILQSIDDALEVFQSQRAPLSAREISMKSMLLTLRLQVAEELSRERNGTKR